MTERTVATRRTLRVVRAVGCVLIAAIALAPGASSPHASPYAERAWVLFRDNRLVVFDAASGRVVARRALSPRAGGALTSRPRLAFSRDGRALYVLVDGEPDTVVVVDVRAFRLAPRLSLEPGIRYRAVLVAGDGTLYVAGNRPRSVGSDAVVTRVAPNGQAETVMVREGEPYDWFVYSAALSLDGSRLLLSYHGGCGDGPVQCTGGADMLDTATLRRCEGQAFRGSGCLGDVHGAVDHYGDGWIAARGEPPVGILDRDGRMLSTFDTRLNAHLMDFALADRALYALADCFKGSGVRTVSLADGSSRAFGPRSVCGSGIAAGAGTVAIIRREVNVPLVPRRQRGIVFVDRRSGRIVRTLGTRSTPLDVVIR
jgi:hypothetical protein